MKSSVASSVNPATPQPEPDPVSAPTPVTAAPTTTTLWLIRHAEVETKYHNVFGGRIDMELSPRGHQQARVLAKYLQTKRLDALYASPMRRVQQTLAPFLVNGAPKARVLQDLREVDFGDWTGLAWDEVMARFGISPFAWLEQMECAGIPNAECAATFRARLQPCLRQILEQHPNQQVAVACHGGVIRMLLAMLLDWPLPRFRVVEIEYASLTQVVWGPLGSKVQLLNFAPWRELGL